MTIDVSGLNRLAVAITKAGHNAPRLAALAVAKTAFDVEATAKTLVPVDTHLTQASIGVTASNNGLTATIGPTTHYAAYLEYGTVHMPPHAFMGPALDRHTPDFMSAIETIGGRIL